MVWKEVACAGAFPGDPVEPRQRSLLQIAIRYIGNRFTEMPSYGGKSQRHPGFRERFLDEVPWTRRECVTARAAPSRPPAPLPASLRIGSLGYCHFVHYTGSNFCIAISHLFQRNLRSDSSIL
jgi:hypothetical protein